MGFARLTNAGFHSAGYASPTHEVANQYPLSYTPPIQGATNGGQVVPGVGVPGTALVRLSDGASKIVGGMAESFLGGEHGVLTPSELRCLSDGAGKLAGGVMDTAGRTAQTYHVLASQHSGNALAASMAAAQSGMSVNPSAQNPVDPLIAGIELSQRLSSMMEFEQKISSKCLKDDAKAELKAASHHLSNVSFMGGRLVANGVDIITELGRAAGAYDDGNYRMFGDNMGLAARKVLISNKGEGYKEMMVEPTDADIQDVTNGLVKQLFQSGMRLQVSTDAITTMAPPPPQYYSMMPQTQPGSNVTQPPAPTLVPWTLLPATEVNVDLHQCVAGNRDLFKDAWEPVWKIMGQMANTGTSGTAKDMNTVEKATGEGAEGFGALAMSMLDMQIAMRRCGFTAEQEAIIYDSMQAGKSIHTKFDGGKFDNEDFTKGDMSETVADAVEDWKQKKFEKFGERMGQALRDITIQAFPEKYYVDADGRLRQRLVQLSGAGRGFALASGSWSVSILASGLLVLAVGLLVIRGRRAITQRYSEVDAEETLDVELAKDEGAVA